MSGARGPVSFFYGQNVPPQAVPLITVEARVSKPADLVDINNLGPGGRLSAGQLHVTPYPSGLAFEALGLNRAFQISGSIEYLLQNQFFQITDQNLDGTESGALFYRHVFSSPGIDNVTLVDLQGNPVSNFLVVGNVLYHSFLGGAYWVHYYADGVFRQELLRYDPALTSASSPSSDAYSFSGSLLKVTTTGTYWFRFTQDNGYQALTPYGTPANDPWYPRVRFSLQAVAKEWANQPFVPFRPYLLATWDPGTVIANNLVDLERKNAFFDGKTYPDLLIYDKSYNLKYALNGSDPEARIDKGSLYPWKRNQFHGFDPANARCHVAVDLDTTDIVFGFYYYAESDLIFRALDINPFTNPAVEGNVVEIYYADRSSDYPTEAMIVNGGFETGDFAGWKVGTSVAIDSAIKHSGTCSARIDASSDSDLQREFLDVFPNQQYLLSFWMKASDSGQVGGWFSGCALYGSAFGFINNAGISSQGWGTLPSVWTQIQIPITIPDGVYYLTVNPFQGGSSFSAGSVWIDDVILEVQE